MLEELKSANPIYTPSPFWEEMNKRHIVELDSHGFHQFKRSVNRKYSNWALLGYFAQHSVPLILHCVKHMTLLRLDLKLVLVFLSTTSITEIAKTSI